MEEMPMPMPTPTPMQMPRTDNRRAKMLTSRTPTKRVSVDEEDARREPFFLTLFKYLVHGGAGNKDLELDRPFVQYKVASH